MKLIALLAATVAVTVSAQTAPEGNQQNQRGQRFNPEEFFKRVDKDGDGKISLEEYKAIEFRGPRREGQEAPDPKKVEERREARFKEMDADQDGFVTQDEFKAAQEKARERRGNRGGQAPKTDA